MNKSVYIEPRFELYNSIESLNRPLSWADKIYMGNNRHNSTTSSSISKIEELLSKDCLCICGEPGCGKSRLFEELSFIANCPIQTFANIIAPYNTIEDSHDIIILDALDEISEFQIIENLKKIAELRQSGKKVYFSCRQHYIERFRNHFDVIPSLNYVKLFPFDNSLTENFINKNLSDSAKKKELLQLIHSNESVRKVCSTPRYLENFVEYTSNSDINNIDDSVLENIFEYVIDKDFQEELNKKKELNSIDLKYVVRSVLEKVAFLMAIRRTDSLTKAELYSVLDNIPGSFITILFSEYGISNFIKQFFKATGEVVQFHMPEVREYLAAKAICGMDSPEYVLYDLAVHHEFNSVYPSWIDVIRHICYIKPEILVNVFPLINREKGIAASLIGLLKYVNVERISEHSKYRLFNEVFTYYQNNAIYVSYSDSLQFLVKSYVPNKNRSLLIPTDIEDDSQLTNACFGIANKIAIFGELFENGVIADEELVSVWLDFADKLVEHHNVQLVVNSVFALWNSTKAYSRIHAFVVNSTGFRSLPCKLQDSFFNHISYCGYEDVEYVSLLIEMAFGKNENCYAISACLHIKRPLHIITIFEKLLSCENCFKRFINPKGSLVIVHSQVVTQFRILAEENKKEAKSFFHTFLVYAVKHTYHFSGYDYNWLSELLNAAIILYGQEFIVEWVKEARNEWDFPDFLLHLDKNVVSVEFIDSIVDNFKTDDRYYVKDRVISILLGKLENQEAEIPSRYQTAFKNILNERNKQNTQNVSKIKKENKEILVLLKSKKHNDKIRAVNKLLKGNNGNVVLGKKEKDLVVRILIEQLLAVNLDNCQITRNENFYTISTDILKSFDWLKYLYKISPDSIYQFKTLIAKLIPCQWILNDNVEFMEMASKIIYLLNNEEKEKIIIWWSKREDNFMDSNSETLTNLSLTLHTSAFVSILESKVLRYINNPCLDNRLEALNAIDAFAQGIGNKPQGYYSNVIKQILFNDETKDFWYRVNGILISKFYEEGALKDRIERIKEPVKLDLDRTGTYALSPDEAELNHPTRFDCFLNCKQPSWIPCFIELIEYAIIKAKESDNLCTYAKMIVEQSARFLLIQEREDSIRKVLDIVNACQSEKVKFLLLPVVQKTVDAFLTIYKPESIQKTLRKFNEVQSKLYAGAQNEFEFISLVRKAIESVNSIIEYEGYYNEMNQPVLEDQIQKAVKIMLEKELIKLGISDISVIREAELYDKKRTDILIKCAFLPPIIIELKRLHNDEIVQPKKMREYKTKFVQYYNATHACYSFYWVFKVQSDEGKKLESKYYDMKEYYKDISSNMDFFITDCCEFARIHQPEKKNSSNNIPKLSKSKNRGKR